MSNIAVAQRPRFTVAMQTPTYQKMINDTLQDPKRRQRFIASITSAVAVNPALQECDPATIISCALLGESLELSPSPQMGQYYLVPFNDRKNDRTVATFILGYKGFKQLAMNSGVYKRIRVTEIKRGELVSSDPFSGEYKFKSISDPLERETAETVGYYGFYELLNGYREELYWSREKMEQHALRFSKGYAAKKGYTFWEKDFDSMAKKTIYRQLLSTAPKSIEMRAAFESDDAVISADGTPDYVGDAPELPPPSAGSFEPSEDALPAEPTDDGQALTMGDL